MHHGIGRGAGFDGQGGRGAGFDGQGGRGAGFDGQGVGFNGPAGSNAGQGGGFTAGRQGNFVVGEASGTAGDSRDQGHGQYSNTEFGGDFGQFNRGMNYNNHHRNKVNQQYRPRQYGNNNFSGNNRYGYNGGRSNFNQFRNNGGNNNDAGVQYGSNLAGITPDLIKEAMQGVVAALAAAAQKGGVEGLSASVLDAVSAATQSATPVVQQSQPVATGSQQVLPMQVDGETMPKGDVPNPAKKAKKVDKNPCFRCKQPGHQIDTCTAPVCDICESPNHISSAYPLLQAPKPAITMYGYAIEQLMFFEVPTGGAYKPKVDNVKLVKVTVEGDPMSIPEIAECLRRIVPMENFQWEIYKFQNNVFRVKFPNKSEAQRMKAFRTYPVPDRASDLIFEDWSALEDTLYMLPEVWLRVRGIPADVRTDFLSLWAVGTLFGKTKEVDMVHTRKHKELRLRIGCIDHTLIPEDYDVFIQRFFFKLRFEVEQVTVTQIDVDVMENNGDNNGGGGNNGGNCDNVDGAKDMDIERTMNIDQQGNSNNQQGTVKKVNNTKSVVAHQVQHQVEVPIVFGSLKKALLNKDENGIFSDPNPILHVESGETRVGTSVDVDAAPGLMQIRSVQALDRALPGTAGQELLLGSHAARGEIPLAAAVGPGVVQPRELHTLPSLPPDGRMQLSAAAAASAAGDRAPSATRGLAADPALAPPAAGQGAELTTPRCARGEATVPPASALDPRSPDAGTAAGCRPPAAGQGVGHTPPHGARREAAVSPGSTLKTRSPIAGPAAGYRPPPGARGLASPPPCSDPGTTPSFSVLPTLMGHGNDAVGQLGVERIGSAVAYGFGLSTNAAAVDSSGASRQKTGISIVVDTENSPSPTVQVV
ncbi:hypothetical protein ACQ4PT_048192 [Festuca glaucescens]